MNNKKTRLFQGISQKKYTVTLLLVELILEAKLVKNTDSHKRTDEGGLIRPLREQANTMADRLIMNRKRAALR